MRLTRVHEKLVERQHMRPVTTRLSHDVALPVRRSRGTRWDPVVTGRQIGVERSRAGALGKTGMVRPWCRCYSDGMLTPPLRGTVGSHPDRSGRPDGRWESGAGGAPIAGGRRRQVPMRRVPKRRGIGREMHPEGTDASRRLRRAAGADRTGWAAASAAASNIRTRHEAASRDPGKGSRGSTGHRRCPRSKPTLSRRPRRLGGIPAIVGDAAAATPSAPNKRPPATGKRHAPGRRKRRQGNCIDGLHAAMRVRIVLVEGRRIAQEN